MVTSLAELRKPDPTAETEPVEGTDVGSVGASGWGRGDRGYTG